MDLGDSAGGGTLFQSVLPAALTSATYDVANRLTNWTAPGGTTLPVYDANGNMTGDGTRTFSWDSRNRLTAITGTAANSTYDGAGRRTSATLAGSATGYLYDGPDIVQEQSGGALSASLLTGLGIDERFSRTAAGASAVEADLYRVNLVGFPWPLEEIAELRWADPYDPDGIALAPLTRDHVLPALRGTDPAAPLCIIGTQIYGKPIWLIRGLPERHEAIAVEGHRV